jgi:hypothetical protein
MTPHSQAPSRQGPGNRPAMIPAVGRLPRKAGLFSLLFLLCICLCVIPAQAAPSDYAPGTHTLTASPSHNYVTFCVPSGMKVSDFREVSTTSCNSYWIKPNNDFGGDIIARNYAGGKILASGIDYPDDTNGPSLRPPVWGCGVYSLITDEYCGSVTISYTISPAGSGDPVSVCSGGCEGSTGTVTGPEVPPKEPEIPWTVVIGGLLGAAVVGGAVVIAKKGAGKTSPSPTTSPPPTGPPQTPTQPKKQPRTTRYYLEISEKTLDLKADNIQNLDAKAYKELEDGSLLEAPEAVIVIDLMDLSTLIGYQTLGEYPHDRRFVLSIDQKKGSLAAFNEKKTALSDPKEFVLDKDEIVRVTAHAGTTRVSYDVKVHITLNRWFPLCFGVKFEWLHAQPDLKKETHLRTNYETVLQDFRDAIARYDEAQRQMTFSKSAHFAFSYRSFLESLDPDNPENYIPFLPPVQDDMWTRDPKMAAGMFLFSHAPPPEVGRMFYFTTPEEKKEIEKKANVWIQERRWSDGTIPRSPDVPSAPPETEAALALKILTTGKPISAGGIFYLALVETEGDIGAAMLLAHNTLRSFARQLGDAQGTGLTALDPKIRDEDFKKDSNWDPNKNFNRKFKKIRGGYRIIDGKQGEPKNETVEDSDFAMDTSGPIYHLFGTAFFEIFTSGPVEEGSSPGQQGWGQMGNKMEQWYREMIPNKWWRPSWNEPDPEKYCVNLWGIAIADEFLNTRPWEKYKRKLKIRGDGVVNLPPGRLKGLQRPSKRGPPPSG